MSESYWSALAKGKERDWWSVDQEGETEKLAGGRGSFVQDRRRIRGSQREGGPLVSSDNDYKKVKNQRSWK